MPRNSGRASRTRVRIARSEQPTSVTDSSRDPVARSCCAIRDESLRTHESRRFAAHAVHDVGALGASARAGAGCRPGSFCRSPSSVTVISPRTASKPAASAAVWPVVAVEPDDADARVALGEPRSTARLRSSRLPSSTKTNSTPPAMVGERRVELAVQRLRRCRPRCRRGSSPKRAAARGSRRSSGLAAEQEPGSRARCPLRAAEPIVTCCDTPRSRSIMKPYTKRDEAALVAADLRASPGGCDGRHQVVVDQQLAAVRVRVRNTK